MMLTVVVVFTVCWMPFNILMVIWTNDESLGGWPPLPYVWFSFHWLAMSHSCYNPIIYCYMNARFRDGFAILLSPVPCVGKLFRGRRRTGTENGGTIGGGTSASMGDHRYGHPMFDEI
ncbi:RYamide receptor-like isoform X2 [Ctenocephalides felis]|uniref:RYamide receptor-like isoform X2 n=1 Tax=Ctenocephalides felis TaxID=7515 RepID=UPI000E6E23FD|nr:RYamide receptor-like isoform X2 [Ctenocephalides felis]